MRWRHTLTCPMERRSRSTCMQNNPWASATVAVGKLPDFAWSSKRRIVHVRSVWGHRDSQLWQRTSSEYIEQQRLKLQFHSFLAGSSPRATVVKHFASHRLFCIRPITYSGRYLVHRWSQVSSKWWIHHSINTGSPWFRTAFGDWHAPLCGVLSRCD